MSHNAPNERCIVCETTSQVAAFGYQGYKYFRCRRCGLLSAYPVPDVVTFEAHYARKFVNGNYQLLRDYAAEYRRVYQDLVGVLDRTLQSYGRALVGLKVLDIGCFTGDFLELLQAQNVDVYGLELQTQAVEIASEKLPGRIYQADVFSSEFPQTEYDAITLLGVIEHALEPVRLIERSTQLLGSGDIIMLQTPDSSSVLARLMGRLWPPCAPVEHIHLFSRKSLKLVLHSLGFEDISFRSHWKNLPVSYVYQMLRNFGPEFHRILQPVYRRMPRALTDTSLPFYIGEIIVTARKQ